MKKMFTCAVMMFTSLITVLNTAGFEAARAEEIKHVRVFIDNAEVNYDVPAQIINDRTMVPISLTLQALKSSAPQYNDALKSISFMSDEKVVIHNIGSNQIFIGGEIKDYDTPSTIIEGRTLIPIRMLTDVTGCSVEWDAANSSVLISTPKKQVLESAKIISVSPDTVEMQSGESFKIAVSANSMTKRVKLSTTANVILTESTNYTVESGENSFLLDTSIIKTSGKYKIYAGSENSYDNLSYKEINVVVNNPAYVKSIMPSSTIHAQNSTAEFIVFASNLTTRIKMVNETDNETVELQSYSESGDNRVFKLRYALKSEGSKNLRFYAGTDTAYSSVYKAQTIDVVPAPPLAVFETAPSKERIDLNIPFSIKVVTSVSASKIWLSAPNSGNADSVQLTDGYTDTEINGSLQRTWNVPWTLTAGQPGIIPVEVNISDINDASIKHQLQLTISSGQPEIRNVEFYKSVPYTGHTIEIVTNSAVDSVKISTRLTFNSGGWGGLFSTLYEETSTTFTEEYNGTQRRWAFAFLTTHEKTGQNVEIEASNINGAIEQRIVTFFDSNAIIR